MDACAISHTQKEDLTQGDEARSGRDQGASANQRR
jgi:hypothetical protein